MPAAAVIPAPMAYTNIAAVKALVVNHWAAGLPSGWPWGVSGRALAGSTPLAVCPCSRFHMLVRVAPAQGPLKWRPRLWSHKALVWAGSTLAVLPGPQPEPTSSAFLENSVCSKHPDAGWMPIHETAKHRPNVAVELCWPWCPFWTIWDLFPLHRKPVTVPPSGGLCAGLSRSKRA